MADSDTPTEEDLAAFGLREGLALAAGLVVLLVAVAVAGEAVERNLVAIEAAVASFGPWSVVAYIGLAVFGASLLLPETLIGVLGGMLFGISKGLAAAFVGFLLASSLQYGLAYWTASDRITRRIASRPLLAAIQREALQEKYTFQVLLRLSPLNPAMVSYAMGAAGIPLGAYLAGCFAYLPYLLIEVWLGTFAHDVATGDTSGAETWIGLLPIAMSLVAVLLVSHRAHRTVLRALED